MLYKQHVLYKLQVYIVYDYLCDNTTVVCKCMTRQLMYASISVHSLWLFVY
jgi:hypothetical protein